MTTPASEALSSLSLLKSGHSYRYSPHNALISGLTSGKIVYSNDAISIRHALHVDGSEWHFTLEKVFGIWMLGGFDATHHYQFRALKNDEEPFRVGLFLDWVNTVRLKYFPTLL